MNIHFYLVKHLPKLVNTTRSNAAENFGMLVAFNWAVILAMPDEVYKLGKAYTYLDKWIAEEHLAIVMFFLSFCTFVSVYYRDKLGLTINFHLNVLLSHIATWTFLTISLLMTSPPIPTGVATYSVMTIMLVWRYLETLYTGVTDGRRYH